MSIFILEDEMLTGIKEIDKEHKELLDSVSRLYTYIRKNEKKYLILEEFDNIVFSILEHFKNEEELFIKNNYYDAKAHIEAHRILKEEVILLRRNFEKDEFQAGDILALLNKWMNEHIKVHDKKYRGFLK